jgi:hypothetical protein
VFGQFGHAAASIPVVHVTVLQDFDILPMEASLLICLRLGAPFKIRNRIELGSRVFRKAAVKLIESQIN